MSRPARGEWIEINMALTFLILVFKSRPARGEWIEISQFIPALRADSCLAPRGASGLKYGRWMSRLDWTRSRPARGEWIEILRKSKSG